MSAPCPECGEPEGCDCLVGPETKKTFKAFLEDCVSDCVNGSSGEWHEQFDHVCRDCGREYFGDFCSACREHVRRRDGKV